MAGTYEPLDSSGVPLLVDSNLLIFSDEVIDPQEDPARYVIQQVAIMEQKVGLPPGLTRDEVIHICMMGLLTEQHSARTDV